MNKGAGRLLACSAYFSLPLITAQYEIFYKDDTLSFMVFYLLVHLWYFYQFSILIGFVDDSLGKGRALRASAE